jgi:hypothetical protein
MAYFDRAGSQPTARWPKIEYDSLNTVGAIWSDTADGPVADKTHRSQMPDSVEESLLAFFPLGPGPEKGSYTYDKIVRHDLRSHP